MQNNTFSGLYLGQNLIVLDEVSSTNDYLKELLSNIKPLPEATAIMAIHQVRGRGQRGNTWNTLPGQNLTFSFVLYPQEFSALRTFYLNMLICLGVYQWLAPKLSGVTVKWPNDIYIGDRKIGGILIENTLTGVLVRNSVIGIGININQLDFPIELEQKATSLRIETMEDQPYSVSSCCLDLLTVIYTLYSQMNLNDTDTLLERYNSVLYRRGRLSYFPIDDVITLGTIKEVNADGQLVVVVANQERTFDLKEIEFLPPNS